MPAWNGLTDGTLSLDGLPFATSRPTHTRFICCSRARGTRWVSSLVGRNRQLTNGHRLCTKPLSSSGDFGLAGSLAFSRNMGTRSATPSWTDDNHAGANAHDLRELRRPFPAWPQMPFQSFFSLAFILPMTRCRNWMQPKIYWIAIFQRRAENLDLTANSPIQSKHRRVEIADDRTRRPLEARHCPKLRAILRK